jgi:hypothetical protein
MLLLIIVLIFRDGFAITFSSDIDLCPCADIFQVTRPLAGCFKIQNKTVTIGIVRASAGHLKVGCEFAAIQFEKGSRTGNARLPPYVQPTTVGVYPSQ